jgi:hypothetical protein
VSVEERPTYAQLAAASQTGASLPDRIARAIKMAEERAQLVIDKQAMIGSVTYELARQVLRAAEVDRRELRNAAELISFGVPSVVTLMPGSLNMLENLAARYGVTP